MRLLVLSDIHANLSALCAVLEDAAHFEPEAVAILGDIIDYGMRPNETIAQLAKLELPVICSLWGNHEHALMNGELARFSSERGRKFSQYTADGLNCESKAYITRKMNPNGFEALSIDGKKYLFVHASLEDVFWESIVPDQLPDRYGEYDYVFSGHSHRPHLVEHYQPADNPALRNRKKTVFINPGSVGQPRNHNPRAQYVIFNTESGAVSFYAVEYDVQAEQKLYGPEVDLFYRERLQYGV